MSIIKILEFEKIFLVTFEEPKMGEKIERRSLLHEIVLALLFFATPAVAEAGLEFPGPAPGDAQGFGQQK